jgi:hypothetical protein
MRYFCRMLVRALCLFVAVPLASLAQVTQNSAGSTDQNATQRDSQQDDARKLANMMRESYKAGAALLACAEQDRRKMMETLHIDSLRPPVETPTEAFTHEPRPGFVRKTSPANYDEDKANVYPKLPNSLVLKNGVSVTTAQMWRNQRRPEIVDYFDRNVYGQVPKNIPRVNWEVKSTSNEKVGDTDVVTKRIVGHVDNSSYPSISVDIELELTLPAAATRPVPVIMDLAFVLPPGFVLPKSLASGLNNNWHQLVLARNWGYATLVTTVYQADSGCGLTKGIIGLVNKGKSRKPDDWGALRAWAWGASRALDYLETDKSVDAKKVAIEGVSRYGKAALVTMAYDQRFAVAFIASSGEGGAKLYRRNFGEPLENVTDIDEYHWMAGNFLKYAGSLNSNDLPVDSHELIALAAPRPVFLSVGNSVDPSIDFTNSDAWADAKGEFMAAVGADPVYRLLGAKGLGTTRFPPIDTGVMDGDLAFRQHSKGHTSAPNWPTFITFAERYFEASSR